MAVEKTIVSTSLPTIHLDLIRTGNDAECEALLDACRSHGLFYLDLSSDMELCRLWEEMLLIMKCYFKQPLEVKLQDARGSDNFGYEPMGTEQGPNPDTRDGYESLKFSRREYLKGSSDLTSSIRSQEACFFSFIKHAHTITLMILSRLSSQLGLTGASRFEARHADPGPSLSTLGLLYYPKHEEVAAADAAEAPRNVGHNQHTDVGSLTFLLAAQWGLQFLSLAAKRWEFIEPRRSHAIINVGDSLRFLSGGDLASVVHRVVPPQTTQYEDRYSIAYFLRVNDGGIFSDTTGRTWSAEEWHDFKFGVFKNPSELDAEGQYLTGMVFQRTGAMNWQAVQTGSQSRQK